MNVVIRLLFVSLAAVLGAIYLGYTLGTGEYVIPITVCAAGTVAFAFRFFVPQVNSAAVCLSILFFGYFISNRSFASVGLGIVYIGEIGMVWAGVSLLLGKGANLAAGFRTKIGKILLYIMALGALRLVANIITGGTAPAFIKDCVRDYATIYYMIFFFFGFALAFMESSKRFMEKSLYVTGFFAVFVLGLPFLVGFNPFEKIMLAGSPVIGQKGDLLGMNVAVFAVLYFLAPLDALCPKMRNRLSLVYFGILLTACFLSQARAAYVGVSLASIAGFFALKGKWSVSGILSKFKQGMVPLVFAIVFAATVIAMIPFLQKKVSEQVAGVYEELVSMTKVSESQMESSSTQNNRFRLVWWRAVWLDVWDENPPFGLGFGEPLSVKRFAQIYELGDVLGADGEDGPIARSPHSIFFTILGRLGVVGAGLFLWFLHQFALATRDTGRYFKAGFIGIRDLFWLLAAWSIMGTALFGVVLEGPMGAIPFWSFLGIGYGVLEKARRTYRESRLQLEKGNRPTQPIRQPR